MSKPDSTPKALVPCPCQCTCGGRPAPSTFEEIIEMMQALCLPEPDCTSAPIELPREHGPR